MASIMLAKAEQVTVLVPACHNPKCHLHAVRVDPSATWMMTIINGVDKKVRRVELVRGRYTTVFCEACMGAVEVVNAMEAKHQRDLAAEGSGWSRTDRLKQGYSKDE